MTPRLHLWRGMDCRSFWEPFCRPRASAWASTRGSVLRCVCGPSRRLCGRTGHGCLDAGLWRCAERCAERTSRRCRMRSPGSTSRSTSCPAGMARHHPCPPETCAMSCRWEALPLAAAVRASAGAWTAPPRRLPCTGLPCREPCLPAPAVRPWCSGRCAGRTSHSTSKRTSGAGVPAVARRGAGSVWTPLHGTACPARPDIGSRHPQASRSRPGRATGHPRGQASSAPPKPCQWQKSKANPPVKRQASRM